MKGQNSSFFNKLDPVHFLNHAKRNQIGFNSPPITKPSTEAKRNPSPTGILLVGDGRSESLKGILFETPREISILSNPSTPDFGNIVFSGLTQSVASGKFGSSRPKYRLKCDSHGKWGRKRKKKRFKKIKEEGGTH